MAPISDVSRRSTLLVEDVGKSDPLPSKVTASEYGPGATAGVMPHDARPASSVVPRHVWPANANVRLAPVTTTGGSADTSIRVAINVSGALGTSLAWFSFRLKNVV